MKRKISAAGRRAISEASKRRWALKRAAEAQPAVAKKAATRKAVAKKTAKRASAKPARKTIGHSPTAEAVTQ